MIDLILEYQSKWANGIIEIGKTKNNFEESSSITTKFINELYDFKNGNEFGGFYTYDEMLSELNFDSALSYFIGNNSNFSEDSGFALNPWVNVEFKNDSIKVYGDIGIAMGNYFFTDENGDKTKVEYSFVYKRIGDSLKIVLHHSSLPYSSN